MREWSDPSGERGAALLSALLIVSLMAVAALALLETVRFSVRASINLADREQARLYALGAESLAIASIRQMRADGDGSFPLLDDWTREPVSFPIRDGQIEVRVRDGANCFNLNALVDVGAPGEYTAAPELMARFARLLEAMTISQAQAESLTATLADWIDSDSRPGFGGAEDDFYGALEEPYRTPGELLADFSQLHLVRGYTPQLVDALAPLACVQGGDDALPLNLNTLRRHHAPLLAAYLGENFNLMEAEQLIAARPVGGYKSIGEFFSERAFQNRQPGEEVRKLFSLASGSYIATIQVRYRQSDVQMTSRLVISGDGQVRTEARRYGS